jgi:hypothetical protein
MLSAASPDNNGTEALFCERFKDEIDELFVDRVGDVDIA